MLPEAQLVVVDWDDAWGDPAEPISIKDAAHTSKPMLISTIGWLLYDGEEGVQIASEYCDDDTFRGRSFIPRGMVRNVVPFKLTKPRRPKHETHDSSSDPLV